jgi:hypothetical protein
MRTPGKSMTADDLRRNMMSTYFMLRLGIVILSVTLPILLLGYSFVTHGRLLESSMSAFYGADGGAMRNVFVGILWAIGFSLFLYQGFSPIEDWLLNAAGVFVVLTAMTPCNCAGQEALEKSRAHAAFAILFFACMVVVCLFCARDTMTLLPEKSDQDRFKRAYYTIALLLFLSPLAALAVAFFARAQSSLVFFIEAFAVWVFAAYWAVKSREFKITAAERRALYGALKNVEGVGIVPEEPSGEQLRRMSGPSAR